MNTNLTKDLIPTNGVRISENSFPKGYFVAKYDANGFTTGNRYFPTIKEAEAYAAKLA